MKPRLILWLLVGLAVLSGLLAWLKLRDRPTKQPRSAAERQAALKHGQVEYTNFFRGYTLLLPASWAVEDLAQPQSVFLGPTGQLTSGTEQQAYQAGAVSVQYVSPMQPSGRAFTQLMRRTVEPPLTANHVTFRERPSLLAGFRGLRLAITAPFPLTEDIVDGPVVLAFGFERKPAELSRVIASIGPPDPAAEPIFLDFLREGTTLKLTGLTIGDDQTGGYAALPAVTP